MAITQSSSPALSVQSALKLAPTTTLVEQQLRFLSNSLSFWPPSRFCHAGEECLQRTFGPAFKQLRPACG